MNTSNERSHDTDHEAWELFEPLHEEDSDQEIYQELTESRERGQRAITALRALPEDQFNAVASLIRYHPKQLQVLLHSDKPDLELEIADLFPTTHSAQSVLLYGASGTEQATLLPVENFNEDNPSGTPHLDVFQSPEAVKALWAIVEDLNADD